MEKKEIFGVKNFKNEKENEFVSDIYGDNKKLTFTKEEFLYILCDFKYQYTQYKVQSMFFNGMDDLINNTKKIENELKILNNKYIELLNENNIPYVFLEEYANSPVVSEEYFEKYQELKKINNVDNNYEKLRDDCCVVMNLD